MSSHSMEHIGIFSSLHDQINGMQTHPTVQLVATGNSILKCHCSATLATLVSVRVMM